MSEEREPGHNIAGGTAGGSREMVGDTGNSETRAQRVVERLGGLYWTKTYGGRSAFECLVRTILSQNTSDVASQPAHDELMARYDEEGTDLAAALARADREAIADAIRSAGLYNRKAKHIQGAAEHVIEEFGGAVAFNDFVESGSYDDVRETLITMAGVGPKTADCVLLFAGGQEGVFPVDTHVHRIYRRMGIAPPEGDHETVREILERDVQAASCGFGHTATIQFGREYCTAGRPACLDGPDACPMSDLCAQVGVDVEAETVVDPAETE